MIAWLLRPRIAAPKPRKTPALPDSVELAGRTVPLLVREHHSARRLTLRLSPTGEVRITVPPRTKAAIVLDFLDRHRGWAEARLGDRAPAICLADGAVLAIRGTPTRIRHVAGRRGDRVEQAPDGLELHVGGTAEHLRRRVRDVLRREALADLTRAVDRHAAASGVKPAGIQIRDTRSRWGSCSSTRRLSFSFRIVMAPPFVLDYLAAHEVAHLSHMNHGPDFWALCRQLCPGMDEGRSWLRTHGAALQAIEF